MSGRHYFVYRVFDDRGLLLYVGCSGNPESRRKQHLAASPLWVQYVSSTRMEGPFEKTAAFARERVVIESERPYFNALSEQRSIGNKRAALSKRLHAEFRTKNPGIFDNIDVSQGLPESFLAASARIQRKVDEQIPPLDDHWRHRNYLNARIQRKALA